MATGQKKKKRKTRTADDYLNSARNLSSLVPSLKKFKKRKTLTKNEKRQIRRREKQLQNIPFLVPVSPAQAKKLGNRKLFKPGVRAIQLRGVEQGQRININKRGDISTSDGNRHWIYWTLPKAVVRSRRGMRDAGSSAFNKEFPIDKVADLAAKAFKQFEVQEVRLWAHAGIVGEGFQDLPAFIRWVNSKWQNGRYITVRQYANEDIYSDPSDPGKWVNGIAILVENPDYTKKRKALARAINQDKKDSRIL